MSISKLLFYTGLITISTSSAALSQECPQAFLGTKTLYSPVLRRGKPVPKGYHPVFINHIGRHGARHLTKEVSKTLAYQLVFKADSAGELTEKGRELKQLLLALDRVELSHVESISEEGITELHQIAARMAINNPELFRVPLKVNVGITKKKRTQQSAAAFLSGFPAQPSVNEYIDDTDLRFYDLSPAYLKFETNGSWTGHLASLKQKEGISGISQALLSKLFTADFRASITAAQGLKLTDDLFGFTTIVYSLQAEIKEAGFKPAALNFNPFFSCAELMHLNKIDEAEDFLKKGPGTNVNGIQVRIAVPLLINFIKTTDEFIAHPKYDLQLRFAHAETVSPFATILGISTADKATTQLSSLAWKAADIAPLSANIQWIIYRNPRTKKVLVKVLLNEKEAKISGMNQQQFPYYPYEELRRFYIKKLKVMGVKLTDDMTQYLQNVGL